MYNVIMKKLKLSKGKYAIVDDEDYEYLNQWKWSLNGMGRAFRYMKTTAGNKNMFLHRQIMKPSKHLVVHHVNGNPLDNRKNNLRVMTQQENLRYKSKYKNNTSGYVGVYHIGGRWRATAFKSGKRINLGVFDTPRLASKARQNVSF